MENSTMRDNQRLFLLLIIGSSFLGSLPNAYAQSTGSLRGTVTLELKNTPVHSALVLIVQLGRSTLTNDEGIFEFKDLLPGTYTVVVHLQALTDERKTVQLKVGETATLDFRVELSPIREEITGTASDRQQTTFDAFQSVTASESLDLAAKSKSSLGEVLKNRPGVAKRNFEPGSSRPVIRGTGFAAGQEPEGGTSPPSSTKEVPAVSPHYADKADPAILRTLKAQIDELKAEYEKRIQGLEAQLEEIQKQLLQAAPESAVEPTSQADGRVVQS
ncbi:MAG: carboxypeptidase regulatory-like domain-containing protein, partial [Acidobacteria bacterium]|nr:carboxypeptidase regulatory-like domain-containing protein [Acidobacteriota bacterium]